MASSEPITFQQIRERAYELWERNHCPEGMEIEFWIIAERELKAERGRRQAALGGSADQTSPGDEPSAS